MQALKKKSFSKPNILKGRSLNIWLRPAAAVAAIAAAAAAAAAAAVEVEHIKHINKIYSASIGYGILAQYNLAAEIHFSTKHTHTHTRIKQSLTLMRTSEGSLYDIK
uniref:Uncharacterized protein n=1 Tax=Glossina palpalis gambiensis TaxID=67801 RepID=A0A1B0BB36_9MUSC